MHANSPFDRPRNRSNIPRNLLLVIGIVSLLLFCLLYSFMPMLFCGTPFILCDCAWRGEAQAWVDENSDGTWDPNELPLAGVEFIVDDINLGGRRTFGEGVGSSVSDADGSVELRVFVAGCPETKMVVYPREPDGYCLTTAFLLDGQKSGPYSFGFSPLDLGGGCLDGPPSVPN